MQRLSDVLMLVTLVIVCAITGVFVYQRLILTAAPLNFDEAAHSLPGFYILRDVRNLDPRSFWGDFHIQTLWPPGFSLLQAPFLALFGTSDSGARLFSYVMLLATISASWLVAREISFGHAALATWIAALISLTAPGWLYSSSLAMQETAVAFVGMLVFWFWLRAYRTGNLLWHLATGCGLWFMFITKYNYAAFELLSIGLVDFVLRCRNFLHPSSGVPASVTRFRILAGLAALYFPILAGIPAWFLTGTDVVSTAIKWRDFSFFVRNEDSGYAMWSNQNLLFYVRTTVNWLMAGWLAAAIPLVGAVWAVLRIRSRGTAMLTIYFVAGFSLASLHQLKADRYITPMFPPLWLLAGLGFAELANSLLSRVQTASYSDVRARLTTLTGCLALAIPTMIGNAIKLEPVWAGATANDLRTSAQQIVAWQRPDQPVLIVGTFGELGPPLFEWRLRTQPAFDHAQDIQYDAPPGDGDAQTRVQNWLAKHPTAQVTVILIAPTSPLYNTNDMQTKSMWKQDLATVVESMPNLVKESQASYAASGIRIALLRQR